MTFRYCAGTEYLVVGRAGGCLTPDSTAAERVWPLIRDGEPIAASLTELLADGLAQLPDFVLVEFEGTGLRTICRGAVDLTVELVDGSAEICSGRTVRTWVERVFPAVTGGSAGQIVKPDLPLMLGVVRAGGFSFDSTGSAFAGRASETPAAPVVSRPLPILPTGTDLPEPLAAPRPASSAPFGGQDPPVQRSRPSELLAETRSEVTGPLFGHVFESTILRKVGNTHLKSEEPGEPGSQPSEMISRLPPAERPSAPMTMTMVPAQSGEQGRRLGDHDGSTVMAGQLAALRAAATAGAAPLAEAATTLAPAVLVLSDGSRVPLDKTVILGRRPQVERVSSSELPYLVTVLSLNQDISRNHLQVRPGVSTLLAADLHATNGTLLRRADGTVVEITDGAEVSVAIGDQLELGDGVVARIEAG